LEKMWIFGLYFLVILIRGCRKDVYVSFFKLFVSYGVVRNYDDLHTVKIGKLPASRVLLPIIRVFLVY